MARDTSTTERAAQRRTLRRFASTWPKLLGSVARVGWFTLSIGAFTLFWWLASLWVDNPLLLPRPRIAFDRLLHLLEGGELQRHIAATLRRLFLGYTMGAAAGIGIGLLMAWKAWAHDLLNPTVQFLRPVPAIALIPLALMVFGIGEQLPVSLIAYSTFFPFALNTISGVQQTPRVIIEAAQTLGATRGVLWRHVLLPAALPSILVAAKISMGLAWMTVVAAELVGGSRGLGFMIMQAASHLLSRGILAGMIVIAAFSYLSIKGIEWLDRRVCQWSAGRRA